MNIRKEARQKDAAERQAAHDLLSVEQKIAKARGRRGKSEREIARLQKQLEK